MTVDWNSRYLDEDTPWCKGRAHPMLAPMIERILPPDFNGRVVVPGCGRGWDLAAIAASRPAATVTGIDVSEVALVGAAAHAASHPGIALVQGDFLDAGWLRQMKIEADFLWEHTCFCAIHPTRRSDFAVSAASVLKPGAVLTGVFFLDLDDGGEGPPWNCPRPEFENHFRGAFRIEHCGLAGDTFEAREGEEYVVIMRRRP